MNYGGAGSIVPVNDHNYAKDSNATFSRLSLNPLRMRTGRYS